MVQYEYRSTMIQNCSDPVRALNKLGGDGWEAYAAIRYSENTIIHFLKRHIPIEVDLESYEAGLMFSQQER